ncbi:MAG: amidohydrolase family protein, partial [Clostridia bacterium]|nr:amidohydrolase family protein [Clostridia bacterium]
MRTFIKNGTIFKEDGISDGILVIEDGKILDTDYFGEIPENSRVIDVKGNYVMPGFVEIHAHGGGGADFMDKTADAFETVAKTHRKHGTCFAVMNTASLQILPTTVAASYESLLKVFETYRKVSASKTINFGGLHLEGPFISMEMKGAQNPAFIRNPEKAEVDALIEAGGDIIKKCTVAPEIPGIDYLAKKFTDNGIYLSSGHSNGTFT